MEGDSRRNAVDVDSTNVVFFDWVVDTGLLSVQKKGLIVERPCACGDFDIVAVNSVSPRGGANHVLRRV